VLFDEEADFPALLNRGAGRVALVASRPFSGAVCLSVRPLQRSNEKIPGWNFQIVEKPAAEGEYRYLRLAWRTAGTGVLIELAASGKWPQPKDPRLRFYAGKNTSDWKATETTPEAPSNWREEIIDLWKAGGNFTLTGIAPTALGGMAYFDRIELLQSAPAKK
jgi:hypothetical protein